MNFKNNSCETLKFYPDDYSFTIQRLHLECARAWLCGKISPKLWNKNSTFFLPCDWAFFKGYSDNQFYVQNSPKFDISPNLSITSY